MQRYKIAENYYVHGAAPIHAICEYCCSLLNTRIKA